MSRFIVETLLQQRRGSGFHFVVLGAGPAGLWVANELQKSGYRVLIIEKSLNIPSGAALSNQRWLHDRGEFYLFTLIDSDEARRYAEELRRAAREIKKFVRNHGIAISEKRRRPSLALGRTKRDLMEMVARQKYLGIDPKIYSEPEVRSILPVRRGVFAGALATHDIPIDSRALYGTLAQKFVHQGGVIWLGAEAYEVDNGLAYVRPSREAADSGGVREVHSAGDSRVGWANIEVTFAHRLVYACGYETASIQNHFSEAFNLAHPIRTFAATKLVGHLQSGVAVAYVGDPFHLHPAGFSLVEHADGMATLCSTRETFNVEEHLGDRQDFVNVVPEGEIQLRSICEADLSLEKLTLGAFQSQRCTKTDIRTNQNTTRSTANILLAPSDWQLLLLSGKATLAPLLAKDVAEFVKKHHRSKANLHCQFPYLARMPTELEINDDSTKKTR
jgi:hypothetical protein